MHETIHGWKYQAMHPELLTVDPVCLSGFCVSITVCSQEWETYCRYEGSKRREARDIDHINSIIDIDHMGTILAPLVPIILTLALLHFLNFSGQ